MQSMLGAVLHETQQIDPILDSVAIFIMVVVIEMRNRTVHVLGDLDKGKER